MDLGGDLRVLDPSMIFQVSAFCALTGRLKLITVDNVASFFFRNGELLYATIDTQRKKIGEFLIENDFISEEQLDKALIEYRKIDGKDRIGNILLQKGFLKREALVSAMREQMKEVVYEVLPWKEGQFVFFNLAEPMDEDILLDVRVDHLILEGLRRMDEAEMDNSENAK
ncbi:MAG: DUF4388 domain-containing protein [Candidatus Krumholzibacteria bacterium]|nr:DUF4388 domain-containing protein [Candidatus Krumholzibacteria bacterium]